MYPEIRDAKCQPKMMLMKGKILVVEDQFIEANNLKSILQNAGYSVLPVARSVADAMQILEKKTPDLALIDIMLRGDQTGIDLARSLQEKNIAFVYLSANSDKPILDKALATKPYGFLVKPFRKKDVLVMLDVAWYLHNHNRTSGLAQAKAPDISLPKYEATGIVGSSPGLKEVLKNLMVVAPSDTSVLILGESGTGKELVAETIHRLSPRHEKPLVTVNCAALPSNLIEAELFGHEKGSFTGAGEKRIGKFELAEGGTVFLDEIGELPTDLQVKFLRFLQEREIEPVGGRKKKIDVRLIAATNRILEEEVAAGRFRLDLYYRLNVFPISIPPLRERKEDILPLAQHFLSFYAKKERKSITGIADQVVKKMLEYSWPGNIRELENLIARSVLLADTSIINTVQLPGNPLIANTRSATDKPKTMTENERDHILDILQKCKWKIFGKGGAAEVLKMNASTLYSRMKKLHIEKNFNPKDFAED
jgi:two-component system, NtrC family, response regulator HydG